MTRSAWRIPGYRVEELLGAGSSGEVWQARVAATGVAVALKRIWLADKEQRKAALAEAAMLAALDHPHLMKLHDVRHVDDDVVLVLDLASGGSLASLLARRGRLTVGEVITAIAPIAAALAYAHSAGVVHGDVSAANIVFTDIGLPLLADLGVARLLGDAAPVRTTPSYADPMLVTGALPGPDSDVFMLGGVALHALTGAPPWPADVTPERLDAVTAGDDPDFAGRLARAGIPGEVAAVVVRALSVEPSRRGSAADFALDLRHAAEPVAVELTAGRARRAAGARPELPLTYGVRAPEPFTARHSDGGRRIRIAPAFATAAALAILLVAAAAWWVLRPGHRPRPAAAAPHAVAPSLVHSRIAPPPRPASPAGVLATLDATRAQAYARRDPDLLAAVYASPALLARDRSQLISIVPAGCGLRGVRTRFGDPTVVARNANGLQLRVTATVGPSTLICGGTASGRAAGTPSTELLVDLVRDGGGYRIAAQRSA